MELCIHMSKLCNGVPDCTDGWDEGPHCRALAPNCTHFGCEYNCSLTVNGPECYCRNAHQLAEDGKACKDFNECTVYGTCSQTCVNTEGSYTCSCVEGYLLQPDNKSCKAKNEPVDRLPVLLIANSQNILATSLSGAPVPNLTPTSTKQTTAMDFNYAEETVCWIHVGDSASSTVLKCSRIPNLKAFAEERLINISLSLHRESMDTQPTHPFIIPCRGCIMIYAGIDVLYRTIAGERSWNLSGVSPSTEGGRSFLHRVMEIWDILPSFMADAESLGS
ncbi:LRP1 protein, partial [Polyodon spathula]|nr:low-density lipoprotein receptor-related protein 1-like [Polyodon spathula]MBN3284997.1 LRP1 protein [Polyodon spathula]